MNRLPRRLPFVHAALGIVVGLVIAGSAAFIVHAGFVGSTPTVAPSPCTGNICTGTMVVGGQTMQYSYTQHLSANGQLRIRLNGGVYSTTDLMSVIVHDLPMFTAWNKLANPGNGAVFLPEEDVNPGRTAYERRDTDGCSGCIVDQVLSMDFSGLAVGRYDFTLSVVQHGESGFTTLTFYVNAAAPANSNESFVWNTVPGMDFPCADSVDNDLDFNGDCADAQCVGAVGQVWSGASCEQPEATCNDEFDNDSDGEPDCLDSDCDGRPGQPSGTALCNYGNEFGATDCGDTFDNDADGLMDCVDNLFNAALGGDANTICWKKTSFGCPATETSCSDFIDNDKDMSYDDSWDNAPLTGGELLVGGEVRCLDYDCTGNSSCPTNERRTASGADADAQCFNGADDDLDHLTDCADTDCEGVINPSDTTQICLAKEFDLGQRYQYCGNAFDDDGDGPRDCADTDCSRRFGNCGPCPAREDYTLTACTDGADNDTDTQMDCADADCLGNFAAVTGYTGFCAVDEDTNDLCADNRNNDTDAQIDCADAGCAGRTGPAGQTCQPAGETSCADAADNDGDSRIDCADSNCWGVGICPAKSWSDASCQTVPRDSVATPFSSINPTVLATVRLAVHAGQPDIIQLQGTGTYSSVTIIVGDNSDPTRYYPYAAASPNCTLSGTNASRFSFTAVAGHALQIFNTAGPDIVTFNLTLTCATPVGPALIKYYPLSLSALTSPGAVAEYGDLQFSTTLYENTKPDVFQLEFEGKVGTFRVPYGDTRRVRAIPNDLGGAAPASSGICSCTITVSGVPHSTDSSCVTAAIDLPFVTDASLAASAYAEDGAGNVSNVFTPPAQVVNVIPDVDTMLTVAPSSPFFRTGSMQADLSARFITGTTDTFNGICDVFMRDTAGTIIGGPPGPTLSFPGMPIGNTIACISQITLPAVADGTYFLTVRVRDSDNDTVVSNRMPALVCNTPTTPGGPEPTNGCQYADFDQDGATEGLYSTLYSTIPRACDNCIGLTNPTQTDSNVNGVGDMCEPNDTYGRCEVDRDIVCECDSDEVCALPCPGPSIGEYPPLSGLHKNPQLCLDAWGICTIGGAICFNDTECTEGGTAPVPGYGLCQDSITACKRDVDCGGVPGTPTCTGANICDNLLFPWLQTVQGNVFSGKRITAPEPPPDNQYNATYCITAKELIMNFSSQLCGEDVEPTSPVQRPGVPNSYTSILGKLDIAGLRAGKYGQIINVAPGSLNAVLSSYPGGLGGRVLRVQGDVSVSAHVLANGSSGVSGAGTIFIDGGDLTITGDLTYDSAVVASLDALASVGWVAVGNSVGAKGNIFIDGGVHIISGAFYAGGDLGFWSVAPPAPDSDVQLILHGLAVARRFQLSRSYQSAVEGSERFIYDGRAVVNPPPGFADVTKSLPVFSDTLPE